MRQRKKNPFVQELGGNIDDDLLFVAEKARNNSLEIYHSFIDMPPHKGIKIVLCLLYAVVSFSVCFLLWHLFYCRNQGMVETSMISPIRLPSDTYHVWECPEIPPPGYPREYPILDVLSNWNTGETMPNSNIIYQGICIFDLATINTRSVERIIQNYRTAEVPFIVRNDPAVRKTVTLWNQPKYLVNKLKGRKFQSTRSNQTLMTYFSLDTEYNEIPDDLVPFTHNVPMSYQEWDDHATRKIQQKKLFL